MKNSIFKSYAKKILRSEAFVSVIVVFVLALGIIGTSYALYMDVDTDTNYQLVEVGDLSIGFDNGDNTIALENMTPMEDDIALKSTENIFSFYIYNTGGYTVNYDINLVPDDRTKDDEGNDLTPNSIKANFINYQICKDNIDNCTDVKTLGTLNDDNSITIDNPIYVDELSPKREIEETNPSAYYFLRLWINNSYNETTGGLVKYKVVINAKNASGYLDNTNTLSGIILNNTEIKINNTVPSFSGVATEEEGLYKAQDDYGTSYYFRGAQSNNYVNFAGFTWRVVRINGDGSIRLILDGSLDKVYRKNEDGSFSSEVAGNTSNFNTLRNDNAYVGYMYGDFSTNSASYEEAHTNVKDSSVKDVIDLFYETYIESDIYHYEKYLADTLFCGDKTLSKAGFNNIEEHLGYGTNKSNYISSFKFDTTYVSKVSPSLECAKGVDNNYSRYTSKIDNATETKKGVNVNNDLKYPIALLSADELVMAGAYYKTKNSSFYLNDPYTYSSRTIYNNWITMSPDSYTTVPRIFYASSNNSISNYGVYYDTNGYGIRPVINLKANTLVKSGDGTYNTPYEILYN